MNFQVPIPSMSFRFSNWLLLDKQSVAYGLFSMGMLLVFVGSLHPWFFWFMKEMYVVPAAVMLYFSYLISLGSEKTFYTREDYIPALLTYILLAYYMLLVNSEKWTSYLQVTFTIPVFFCMLRANEQVLQRVMKDICRIMAFCLIISAVAFLLYLLGFPFPSRSSVFGDHQYSFENYYLFMLDDRFLAMIIPRFSSVFLEPGHLGTATAMMLLSQMGNWKKWYNITLFVVTLITFSLAAYGLLFVYVFLNMWVQRKHLIGKLMITLAVIGISIGGIVLYNDGDNMVYNLILLRLEVDDRTGEMVGNNRVTEDFEKEFDDFVMSSDVVLGRDMKDWSSDSGNSGYRVFIYEYGLVGLVLVILFYVFAFRAGVDYRFLCSVAIASVLLFWSRGYLLWYSNFLPLLATALRSDFLHKSKRKD